MDKNVVVPLALFASIVLVIKFLVDARMRYLFWKGGSTPEAVAAMFAGEAELRRAALLRWGLVCLALGGSMALVDAQGLPLLSVGSVAILLLGLGGAQVLAWWLAGRGRLVAGPVASVPPAQLQPLQPASGADGRAEV
jgi:hypothetical protein